jgi:hypothetical protein
VQIWPISSSCDVLISKLQYLSQKASFSRCGLYRYSLQRRWHQGEGQVCFIGLNPSTADHRRDDPTIRRCVGFAHGWGFAGMEIVNLFAFRATYPEDLKAAVDPVGAGNARALGRAIRRSELAIACWGNDGAFLGQAGRILRRFPELQCIRLNSSKQPAHPLYLPAGLVPQPLPPELRDGLAGN